MSRPPSRLSDESARSRPDERELSTRTGSSRFCWLMGWLEVVAAAGLEWRISSQGKPSKSLTHLSLLCRIPLVYPLRFPPSGSLSLLLLGRLLQDGSQPHPCLPGRHPGRLAPPRARSAFVGPLHYHVLGPCQGRANQGEGSRAIGSREGEEARRQKGQDGFASWQERVGPGRGCRHGHVARRLNRTLMVHGRRRERGSMDHHIQPYFLALFCVFAPPPSFFTLCACLPLHRFSNRKLCSSVMP